MGVLPAGGADAGDAGVAGVDFEFVGTEVVLEVHIEHVLAVVSFMLQSMSWPALLKPYVKVLV